MAAAMPAGLRRLNCRSPPEPGGPPRRSARMADATILPFAQATLARSLRAEGRDGHSIGTTHSLLFDKASGQARFAVLSLGGMLGIGTAYYPVPWSLVTFDPVRDVYVVGVDKALLTGGPSWASNAPTFDQAYGERVASYYGGAR
jgi:hypothetical protein